MSLRHWLAAPALVAHRTRHMMRQPSLGFRSVLFHATPTIAPFVQTIDAIETHHGFVDPKAAFATTETRHHKAPVLLTFDDGLQSNYTVAAPVLEDAGAGAIFFVCPGLHDLQGDDQKIAVAQNVFRGNASPASVEPLMTWDQIADLAERGHVIGAHGMTHTRLSTLSGDALAEEIEQAGAVIKSRIGAQPDWYAWAFGDIDSISAGAMAVIQKAYPYCRSGIRGLNEPETSPHAVRAEMIDLNSPGPYQALALEGGFDGRYASARVRLDEITNTAQGS